MDDGAEEDKEMPNEVGTLPLQDEGDDPDGVDDAAGQCGDEERQVFRNHPGKEDQPAPAQHDEKRDVQRLRAAGAENGHKDDPGEDHSPLDDAKDRPKLTLPEQQPHRCESSADQQVDGDIVKPAPEAFDLRSPAERMVQAAHQEHHDQAGPVDDRAQQLYRRSRTQKQQHKARDSEQRADSVGDRIADFFKDGTLRRFVRRPGTVFHNAVLLS